MTRKHSPVNRLWGLFFPSHVSTLVQTNHDTLTQGNSRISSIGLWKSHRLQVLLVLVCFFFIFLKIYCFPPGPKNHQLATRSLIAPKMKKVTELIEKSKVYYTFEVSLPITSAANKDKLNKPPKRLWHILVSEVLLKFLPIQNGELEWKPLLITSWTSLS